MKCFPFSGRLTVCAVGLLISFRSHSIAAQICQSDADTVRYERELEEVVVKAERGKTGIGRMTISGLEINSRPALFGEHDVIKALQSTSGVAFGSEGFAGLYVRGGETDQNLYLLDGLPLLNVYHFGGLFSTFNPNAVGKVDFYKGVFHAPYAERASSIVDVSLKRPDYNNICGTLSVGLVSGQFYFSTPLKKGRSALSVALRRTWFDVFSTPALAIVNAAKKSEGKKNIFHYNFTDLAVKVSATDSVRNDISLLMFYGKDNFKLGDEHFDPNDEIVFKRDVCKMSWGNWGASLDYRLSTSIGNLRLLPYVSKAFSKSVEENMNKRGNYGHLSAVTSLKPSVLQAGMKESFEFDIINGFAGEAGLQQTWYDYCVGNPLTAYDGYNYLQNEDLFSNRSRNTLLSAFCEFHWDISEKVVGSVGVRGNFYLSNNKNHCNIEPRFSMKMNLPHRSDVTLGYSRVSQYAQQLSSNYMYLPSDAWIPVANCFDPLICDIYSLGYSKTFRNGFNVGAEVWWKNMNNMAEYKPNTSAATVTMPWNDKLTFGKGWAYGLDIETIGEWKSVNWSVAYGLMWNWRKFAQINFGIRYPAKFDNRHKLDINVGWKINERLELNGQWVFMTGNRVTLALYNIASPDIFFPDAPFISPLDPSGQHQDGVDYYEHRNNVRLPAFHRLNLSLSLKGRINKSVTYRWEFGLYNAYCRMNPFSVLKSYDNYNWVDDGSHRKFKTLSLLPILPSVSYTINF